MITTTQVNFSRDLMLLAILTRALARLIVLLISRLSKSLALLTRQEMAAPLRVYRVPGILALLVGMLCGVLVIAMSTFLSSKILTLRKSFEFSYELKSSISSIIQTSPIHSYPVSQLT